MAKRVLSPTGPKPCSTITKNTMAKHTIAKNTIAKHTIAKNTIAKDIIAKNAIAKVNSTNFVRNQCKPPEKPAEKEKRCPKDFQEEIVAVIRCRILNDSSLSEEELQPMLQPLLEIIFWKAREEIDFDHWKVLRFCDDGLKTLESQLTHRARFVRIEYCQLFCDASNMSEQLRALGRFLDTMHVGYEHSPNDLQPLLSMVSLMALEVLVAGYPYIMVDIAKAAINFVAKKWKVSRSSNSAPQRFGQISQPPSSARSRPVPSALLHLPTQPILIPENLPTLYQPKKNPSQPPPILCLTPSRPNLAVPQDNRIEQSMGDCPPLQSLQAYEPPIASAAGPNPEQTPNIPITQTHPLRETWSGSSAPSMSRDPWLQGQTSISRSVPQDGEYMETQADATYECTDGKYYW